jgi:hypothetical protein
LLEASQEHNPKSLGVVETDCDIFFCEHNFSFFLNLTYTIIYHRKGRLSSDLRSFFVSLLVAIQPLRETVEKKSKKTKKKTEKLKSFYKVLTTNDLPEQGRLA